MNATLNNTNSLVIPKFTITADRDLDIVIQEGTEGIGQTFLTQLTYEQCATYFELEDPNIPERERLQRDAEKSRINNICGYLVNRNNTVFPSALLIVTALEMQTLLENGVNGYVGTNIYKATIKSHSDRLFIDGQGRIGAIKKAILERPEIAGYTLNVKIVVVKTVTIRESSKFVTQLFSDLHLGLTKPNSSQSIYFDSESSSSRLAKEIIEVTEASGLKFGNVIAVNGKLTLGKIFTLANLIDFIMIMVGESSKKSANKMLNDQDCYKVYLSLISKYLYELYNVLNIGHLQSIDNPGEAKEYINSNIFYCAIGLKALAYIGRSIIEDSLHNQCNILNFEPLTKIKTLPVNDRTADIWINKEIYQIIQGKTRIVKSSEKRLANLVCQKIRIIPCSSLI
ncbi:DGQHR domain-containing protein [Shewanella sp. SG44-6]|jgi:DGQHR domain-containing protein|uniref:DNA sulfur modification protein DndB n=1 Tax=Shewanella sp. SG44-6 TaxID=2760959 RepID=UPI0016042A79|nr:DNA sulfur modification protein DndB [Shewanella sp. SG44-6]MBB1389489.1 DGQHR domain-containing protein [Shewanella sp. SG44-6]